MPPADPIAYALKYHVQNAREPQWCEHCEEAWPCVTKMLADRLDEHQHVVDCIKIELGVTGQRLVKLRRDEMDERKKHSPKRSRKK